MGNSLSLDYAPDGIELIKSDPFLFFLLQYNAMIAYRIRYEFIYGACNV